MPSIDLSWRLSELAIAAIFVGFVAALAAGVFE